MSILRLPSTHRPEPLKDTDYDHEILLLDHTPTAAGVRNRDRSESHIEFRNSLSPDDAVGGRRSEDQPEKRWSLRTELAKAKTKYSKYRDRGEDRADHEETARSESRVAVRVEEPDDGSHPRSARSSGQQRRRQSARESEIDILFENQRGCLLCRMPLFSSKALGCADVAPWTTAANKPSATDVTNAQVPDPSWEWSWKEWSINRSDRTDEDGWEYSFLFSKKFSWHRAKWWNSFVRQRAWVRMRVRRSRADLAQDANTFSSDYFTVPRSRAVSRTPSGAESPYGRTSIGQAETSDSVHKEDIHDIDHLMETLKHSRIDRERTEAIENFVKNGGEDLSFLKERMHEIMSQFVFQASRRHLLAHLMSICEEASRLRQVYAREGAGEDPAEARRIESLSAAIGTAQEEVKQLEYWSDIKGVVEKDGVEDTGRECKSLDNGGAKDSTSDTTGKACEIINYTPADKGKGRA